MLGEDSATSSQRSLSDGEFEDDLDIPPKSPVKSVRTTGGGFFTAPPPRPSFLTTESGNYGSASLKFRVSVGKVIEMRKASQAMAQGGRGEGSEPGIDPRRASANDLYGHIQEKCEIEVTEYSSGAQAFNCRQMDNASFLEFINSKNFAKPADVKVRWINVGGISWDVLSALAIRYDLHPLSLEDVIHSRATTRTKADYFNRHLFIHVLCHSLQEDSTSPLNFTNQPRSTSPTHMSDDGHSSHSFMKRIGTYRRRSTRRTTDEEISHGGPAMKPTILRWKDRVMLKTPEGRKKAAEIATLEVLKSGERVNVLIRNTFFFLLRDGTVISIHQTDRSFGDPILARLGEEDSVLRRSADPSLLLQALIDLVVDKALAVVDRYGELIAKFEREVLLRTSMNTVRHLHILAGDLVLHKRTMAPIRSLVLGLRRYDLDRCAALVADSHDASTPGVASHYQSPSYGDKVVGYMSHKAKVYLADVQDHTEYILASLDMYSALAETMVSYTFNMASRETNEVMRRMTLAMIIFLPLTLLTGYFGMNFKPMPAVDEHSDILFWQIALPVMAVIIPLFLWNDIERMIRYLKKQAVIRRLEREQLARKAT